MGREENSLTPIVDYLEKNLAKGYQLESLKWALVNQKHSKIEIEKAIKIIEARRPKKVEETPKVELISKDEIQMPEKKSFWKKIFG